METQQIDFAMVCPPAGQLENFSMNSYEIVRDLGYLTINKSFHFGDDPES